MTTSQFIHFSPYSFIMAILGSSFFIIILLGLRRQSGILNGLSLYALLAVMILSLLRIFIPFEFSSVRVISSTKILTSIIYFLEYKIPFIDSLNYTIEIQDILIFIWFIVSAIIFCRKFKNYKNTITFFRILPLNKDKAINDILLNLKEDLNIHKNVNLIIYNEVKSPLIIGYLNPIIMLPNIGLSDAELKGILTHELMHLKYNHTIYKLISEILVTIFWWNPFFYILCSETNNVLEFHADKKLSEYLNRKQVISYLDGIIKVVDNYSEDNNKITLSFSLVEKSNQNMLNQRFILLTKRLYSNKNIKNNIIFISIMCVFYAVSYMFIIQPAFEPTEEDYADGVAVTENSYILTENGLYVIYDENDNKLIELENLEECVQNLEIRNEE